MTSSVEAILYHPNDKEHKQKEAFFFTVLLKVVPRQLRKVEQLNQETGVECGSPFGPNQESTLNHVNSTQHRQILPS